MKNWIKVASAAAVGIALSASAASAAWDKVVIATEGAYPPFNEIDANGNMKRSSPRFRSPKNANAPSTSPIITAQARPSSSARKAWK